MQPIKIITIVVVAVAMSACSLMRPAESTPTPAYHMVSQQQRVANLNRIQSWTLQGSISIQQTTRTDLASLQWTQQRSQYHFALFGPLGSWPGWHYWPTWRDYLDAHRPSGSISRIARIINAATTRLADSSVEFVLLGAWVASARHPGKNRV